MSNAFKCDRCGEFVEGNPKAVAYIRRYDRRQNKAKTDESMLCEYCKREVQSFLRGNYDE